MSNYLIIGASSGIGKELARQLVKEGNQVWGSYNQHQVKALSGVNFFPYDVMKDEWKNEEIPDELHGLVYCPGSIQLKPFGRIKEAALLEDIQLNVSGAVKIIQGVLPKLKKSDWASIVLFSTVAVQLGLPFHSQVAISKGAIEGLTKALAAELAPGIRVNCIAPSLTDTPMASSLLSSEEKREVNAKRHPLRRIGKAEDIAAMAAFLLSNKSSWISGQIMPVDGGMSSIRN
ncbi:SDR family NAD(P)-dependent oxidoreductase [Echinicola shivajiensis]|uniref:SDR family NAD(P)-dependent oxidoreductase n=1 Tax=Echinicola shivajiensis TaxID=1035916 RepID=UPI001BFC92E6|nr:SDR family oxidoreductase [Echinicola shivajiensis]